MLEEAGLSGLDLPLSPLLRLVRRLRFRRRRPGLGEVLGLGVLWALRRFLHPLLLLRRRQLEVWVLEEGGLWALLHLWRFLPSLDSSVWVGEGG